eukprot:COSAG01_NODE_39523_length_475_cov_1.337766_1_plen_56_part_01
MLDLLSPRQTQPRGPRQTPIIVAAARAATRRLIDDRLLIDKFAAADQPSTRLPHTP